MQLANVPKGQGTNKTDIVDCVDVLNGREAVYLERFGGPYDPASLVVVGWTQPS